jgi:protoporphyrinogen oxidase
MPNVVILGGGMAGFGAANRLRAEGLKPVLYEQNGYIGGNAASFRDEQGFLFDVGPHISFTKDPRIQNLLAESVGSRYETLQISLNNYWQGHWPRHPVQLHLHGLPVDVIVKVIEDFVAEKQAPERPVGSYADWLVASFGRTFAELFPMRYTRKYHVTTAENMSADWVGPRIYRPSLEEVLRGALSPSAPHIHYITDFRYPTEGGFVSYLDKFLPFASLMLDHRMVGLDLREQWIRFSNGAQARYDALISSVPLPDLVRAIDGVPPDVLQASARLACSTCVLVNLGVSREDLSKAHMTYFYDEDVCFSRLSFPHMLSTRNAPPGTGSIQAEVYFSAKYRPLPGRAEDWIGPVVADLRRCGVLRQDDRILSAAARLVPFANIIFDLERAAALERVHEFLDQAGIAYCGRYGDWGYLWSDEAFKSGESAAQKALDRLSGR